MKEEVKIELTKLQTKHLKSIEWLFDENNRQEGRTSLLAFVYIKQALSGRNIAIIDHAYITTGAGYRANKMLADMIQQIIIQNKLPLIISWSNLTLTLKK